MSRRIMIKVRTVPGATITDRRFLPLPLLKKTTDTAIVHAGTIIMVLLISL